MNSQAEILVGLSISLTGKFSRQGQQALNGIQLWQDYTNAQGGIALGGGVRRPVRLIHYDDQSRVSNAQENTLRLVREERVDVLLGPYSSALTVAAAGVAGKYEKILWNHGGSSDELFQRRLRFLVSTPSPASDYLRGLPAWLVKHMPELRRICLVYLTRGMFAGDVARGFWEGAEAAGVHNLDFVSMASPIGSAEAVVDEMRSHNPEAVVLAGRFKDELQLLQARQVWPDSVKVVAAVAAGVQEFYDELQQGAEGVIGPSQWEPTVRCGPNMQPDSDWFVENFQQRFGQPPDYPAAGGFAVGLVLAECIGRTGSLEDERLRPAAAELEFQTFYGRFKLEPKTGRQIGHRVLLTQWQQGRKVVLAGDEAGT